MFELRILNGLQTGARLALDETSYLLGSSNSCDIVLCGNDIASEAALISIQREEILLVPQQSPCGLTLAESTTDTSRLSPGQPFRIGEIWLAICQKETAWPTTRPWAAQEYPAETVETLHAADTAVPLPGTEDMKPKNGSAVTESRRGAWLVAGLLLTMAAGVSLAYGVAPMAPSTPESNKARMPAPQAGRSDPAEAPAATPAPPAPCDNCNPPQQQASSPSAPFDVFAQQLREANLLPLLTLKPEGRFLGVSGDLDSGDTQRFLKLLSSFADEYGDKFVITARLGMQDFRRLPFRIRQIVSGPAPHVVTDDAIRLFEGGTYKGYQLVSIGNYKLSFAGEHPVEIRW